MGLEPITPAPKADTLPITPCPVRLKITPPIRDPL
jgi:hypothetical protein